MAPLLGKEPIERRRKKINIFRINTYKGKLQLTCIKKRNCYLIGKRITPGYYRWSYIYNPLIIKARNKGYIIRRKSAPRKDFTFVTVGLKEFDLTQALTELKLQKN